MLSEAREYNRLGDNRKERALAYRALFRQKLDAELVQKITEATQKGWVLGDSRFALKIEQLSGRRATQLPKGRPKGS
jgi:putative transposase